MKKTYLLALLAATVVLAGCKDADSVKDADESTTTQETEDEELVPLDEEEIMDLDAEFEVDASEEIIDVEEEEVSLDPITPSEYLVENCSDYVTLGDCDGIEVTKYVYEITDEMVQEEIQMELEDASEEESVDTPAAEDNLVYLNMTSAVDGEEDSAEEETFLVIGQEEYGAEFDKQLTGAKTGDHLEFSVSYGDDIWVEDWIGKTVNFSLDITDVTRTVTPEYNEEYVTEYTGYESIEAYEASVREYLEQYYEEESAYELAEEALSVCLEKAEFTGEYPEELMESCKDEVRSAYAMFASEEDSIEEVMEMFGITEADIEEQAEELINRRLFVSAYAKEKKLEVTEEEYVNYVAEYAGYYGMNASEFEEFYTRAALVSALYENKVTESLVENAKVVEKAYEEEDFEELEELDDLEDSSEEE